jgi:hypothetical protein
MGTHIPAQPHFAQGPRRWKVLPCLTAILAVATFSAAATLHASTQSPTPQAAPHKTAQAHKKIHAAKQQSAVPQLQSTSVTPPAPKPPDWPANDHPLDAIVVWNSHGLRIDAANSSLSQILNEVSTIIGTRFEGLGPGEHFSDQRIFGSYGPGPARDVLLKLLDGSGYNVLMIGDQGQGTPRSIVLSTKNKPGAPQVANDNGDSAAGDESADTDDQPQQPQPQPQPPSNRNGFAPGAPPRSPQQIMQEMQQRQQQMQQATPPQ